MSPSPSDPVRDSFRHLQEQMVAEVPELQAILDQAKAGELAESKALEQMIGIVLCRPELAKKFMGLAKQALAPLQEPGWKPPMPEQPGGAMFHSGVGLPQVNPLVQGAMVERRQFDGDVPEWRTGPLPEELLPSVPIRAAGVRNPQMMGNMLHEAALRLGHHVQEHQRRLVAEAEVQRALQRADDPLPLALLGGSAETDLPEYRRGQVPAPLEAPEVPALELDSVNASQEVWLVLGTTQGRASAAPVIEVLVLEAMQEQGFRVGLGPAQAGPPQFQHQWTMHLAGVREIQAGFNPIDTAARVLTFVLGELAKSVPARPLLLTVRPFADLASRQVGWAGSLWEGMT
ncbi:MAG: hypothetical protein A2Y38_02860 [Spirochaetes bacterium GWB1_59_5]|nr:MAG: hypothetical protein A2Y38_02860 [Spirochaetes bacterium GWB1_59_5]